METKVNLGLRKRLETHRAGIARALPGKFKVWCLQFGMRPRIMWPCISRVERIERKCSVCICKWLGLPRQLNNTALYGEGGQRELPVKSFLKNTSLVS